jgi:Ca2+-binding EF-hand superfamily protein
MSNFWNENSEKLRIVFEAYDRNSDGMISKEDLKEVLRTLEDEGVEVDHSGIDRFLKKADLNGDGLIDFHGESCA